MLGVPASRVVGVLQLGDACRAEAGWQAGRDLQLRWRLALQVRLAGSRHAAAIMLSLVLPHRTAPGPAPHCTTL